MAAEALLLGLLCAAVIALIAAVHAWDQRRREAAQLRQVVEAQKAPLSWLAIQLNNWHELYETKQIIQSPRVQPRAAGVN